MGYFVIEISAGWNKAVTFLFVIRWVRAYNLDNIYNKRAEDVLKIFAGFKIGCASLCMSDGFMGDAK